MLYTLLSVVIIRLVKMRRIVQRERLEIDNFEDSDTVKFH